MRTRPCFRWPASVAIILTVLAVPALSQAQADTQSRLDHGEILISSRPIAGSELPEVTLQAVVDAPASKIWKIIDDCGNYQRTMPRIASSKQLERTGSRVVCQVEVSLPFPLSNLTGVTEAVHTIGPPKWQRVWHLLRGDYEKNDGSWTLTPFDADGKRTLVVYKIHAIPKTSVPNAILRKGQRESLPKMIEHLREVCR